MTRKMTSLPTRAAALSILAFVVSTLIASCNDPNDSVPKSPALMLASLAVGPSQIETESSPTTRRFKQQLDGIAQRCDGVDQFAMADAIYRLHEFTKKRGNPMSIEELLTSAYTLSGDAYDSYKEEGSCIDLLKVTVATVITVN